MATEKKYFHDKLILLLLTANIFLTVIGSIMLLLRIGNSNFHIVQFRSDLGLNAFKNGSDTSLDAFVVFMLLTLVAGSVLSYRMFNIRRDYSVIILTLGFLLIILSIIVSNALIVLP